MESIRAKGNKATFVQTDVSKSDHQEAVKKYGGVDILFSNVGVVIGNAIADVSEQEWEQVMAVNLKSMFLCCK